MVAEPVGETSEGPEAEGAGGAWVEAGWVVETRGVEEMTMLLLLGRLMMEELLLGLGVALELLGTLGTGTTGITGELGVELPTGLTPVGVPAGGAVLELGSCKLDDLYEGADI